MRLLSALECVFCRLLNASFVGSRMRHLRRGSAC
jgi:hypothetical protein